MTAKKKVPDKITLFLARNVGGEVEVFNKRPHLSKEDNTCYTCSQPLQELDGNPMYDLCDCDETDKIFPWLKDLGPIEVVELELVFVSQQTATLKPIKKKVVKKVAKKKAYTPVLY